MKNAITTLLIIFLAMQVVWGEAPIDYPAYYNITQPDTTYYYYYYPSAGEFVKIKAVTRMSESLDSETYTFFDGLN